VLPNGNYVVGSLQWDNGTIVDAGARHGAMARSAARERFLRRIVSSARGRTTASAASACRRWRMATTSSRVRCGAAGAEPRRIATARRAAWAQSRLRTVSSAARSVTLSAVAALSNSRTATTSSTARRG
jgi:hypothetical protein